MPHKEHNVAVARLTARPFDQCSARIRGAAQVPSRPQVSGSRHPYAHVEGDVDVGDAF